MPKALSEMISEDLYSMITEGGKFPPGSKLPNEIELSKMFNINRATLRVAIRILVTRGILEIKRGKGTFVRNDFNPEKAVLAANDEFVPNEAAVKDLYEMRMVIEPEAAYFATQRGSEKEIKNIIKIGMVLEQKLIDNVERVKEEQEFHKAIAKATHNEYINKIMPILVRDMGKAVRVSFRIEELREETIRDHKLIMDFMQRRDAEGAKAAMRLHMVHAIKLITERT